MLLVFQPAGNIEEFFQKLGEPPKDLITAEQAINKTYTEAQVKSLRKLFRNSIQFNSIQFWGQTPNSTDQDWTASLVKSEAAAEALTC